MIDPIAVGLTKEYVLESDDKDNPTIWLISALDSLLASKIVSAMGKVEIQDDKPIFVPFNDLAENDFSIIKYGLKGFKNFKIDGVDIPFETVKEKSAGIEYDVVSQKTISQIPLFVIHELAMEIWGSNNVDKALRKN